MKFNLNISDIWKFLKFLDFDFLRFSQKNIFVFQNDQQNWLPMFLSFILFLLRSLKKDDISRIFVASLTIISLIFNISRFRKKISRIFGFRCIFPFHTSYFPSFQHIIVRYIKTYLRFGVINYSVNSITRYNSLTKSHPNSEALFRTRSAV